MSAEFEYGALREDDEAGLISCAGLAFNASGEAVRGWWEKAGRENIRVARIAGQVVGGLIRVPMAHVFGGRPVASLGIAGVAVSPEVRGRGVARQLMMACLRESREAGCPLSTLYASTFALYRSVGYERAGVLLKATLRIRDLPREKAQLEVRAASEADHAIIEELSRQRAAGANGFAVRGPYLWRRNRAPKSGTVRWYLVLQDSEPQGYVALVSPDSGFESIQLSDWAAATPAALQTIRAFVATHGTIYKQLELYVAPDDPLILSLPERHVETKVHETWMLRLADVAGALEQRGYPRGLSAELQLEITGDALAENSRRYVVKIADGRARVEPGGAGSVRVGVATLASLYSSHASAESWRLAGGLSGSADQLEALTTVFAGPAPAMVDFF